MRHSWTNKLRGKYYINSKRRERFGSSNTGQLIIREAHR